MAWCDHKADPFFEDEEKSRLTTYAAHSEAFSHASDGCHIVEWGGEWDEGDYGYVPDWWFVAGSDFEIAANPTHFIPLPAPPGCG